MCKFISFKRRLECKCFCLLPLQWALIWEPFGFLSIILLNPWTPATLAITVKLSDDVPQCGRCKSWGNRHENWGSRCVHKLPSGIPQCSQAQQRESTLISLRLWSLWRGLLSTLMCVCLMGSLPSGHSYEDKLIGFLNSKTGCLSLLPLCCPLCIGASYEFVLCLLQPYGTHYRKPQWLPEPGNPEVCPGQTL